ncbi:MAG: YcxB family protein [Verrucomicrobiae bacterium]|nr:YcxB family protein [Verrucomicrobiae bacterium]
MTLKYRNTHQDYIAPYFAKHPNCVRDATRNFYSQMALWWFLLFLAACIAFKAGMLITFFVFMAALGYSISRSIHYGKRYRESLIQSSRDRPETNIVLQVDEEGFTEKVDEIVSVAPWRSVTRFYLIEKRLLLELSSGSFAIIPRDEIHEGAEHFEALITILKEKGIPDRTAGVETRKS